MKIVKVIEKIEKVLIAILFTAMVLAVFGQVVNRNILKLDISWFEEVARGCMVYMLMFGTEISLREHSQLNVDSVVRRLPAKGKAAMDVLSIILTAVFSGVVGITSIHMITTSIEMGGVMPALQVPRWWFQGCVTVGCLLIFVTQLIVLFNTLFKAFSKKGEENK